MATRGRAAGQRDPRVILDIVPTLHTANVTESSQRLLSLVLFSFSRRRFEQLIEAAPEAFLRRFLSRPGIPLQAFAECLRALREPALRTACVEDYRAGATIDEQHEAATRAQRPIARLLVLGERGFVGHVVRACGCGVKWRRMRGKLFQAGTTCLKNCLSTTLSASEFILANPDLGVCLSPIARGYESSPIERMRGRSRGATLAEDVEIGLMHRIGRAEAPLQPTFVQGTHPHSRGFVVDRP